MKAKLISTTNHGMSHYAGIPGELKIQSYALWIGGHREQIFHTSAIVSHAIDGNTLTLNTLNSVYVFEIIEGEFDASLLTSPPQRLIDKHRQKNETEYTFYWCQILGNPLIDNAISITELPYPMNLQEARDYAAINMIRDVTGEIVTHILTAKQ